MNPLGILIIGIGLVMVIIGVKGTQHQVVSSLGSAQQTAGQDSGSQGSGGSSSSDTTSQEGT
jgi:hypothetical protein